MDAVHPAAALMAGAGKKRQQVDRRRGGSGRGGSSSASDPAPTGQPAQSPTTQATQAQPPFGYDGSNSPPASAREPVQPSPQPGSTAAPTVSSPTPPAASTAGNLQGRDPAPPAEVSRPTDINRRLDLPPAAYNLDGQVSGQGPCFTSLLQTSLSRRLSCRPVMFMLFAIPCGQPTNRQNVRLE